MESGLAYQEEPWEELIDGKVILMSPRPVVKHNWVAENISYLFRSYLRGKKCVPLGDGYDLYLSEKDRFVPDFMVVCDRDKIKPKGVFGAPDLVVEVLSPSTAVRDRGLKRKAYGTHGVREYWIVDPVGESVEQYFLQDGELEIAAVHTLLPEDQREEGYTTAFQCSLYDDLTLHLEDVFSKMISD